MGGKNKLDLFKNTVGVFDIQFEYEICPFEFESFEHINDWHFENLSSQTYPFWQTHWLTFVESVIFYENGIR